MKKAHDDALKFFADSAMLTARKWARELTLEMVAEAKLALPTISKQL